MNENEVRAIVADAVREAMGEFLRLERHERRFQLAELVREAVHAGLNDVVISRDPEARRELERYEPLAIDVMRMGDRLNYELRENVVRLREQVLRFEDGVMRMFGRPWGGSPTVCNYSTQDIADLKQRVEDIATKLNC